MSAVLGGPSDPGDPARDVFVDDVHGWRFFETRCPEKTGECDWFDSVFQAAKMVNAIVMTSREKEDPMMIY